MLTLFLLLPPSQLLAHYKELGPLQPENTAWVKLSRLTIFETVVTAALLPCLTFEHTCGVHIVEWNKCFNLFTAMAEQDRGIQCLREPTITITIIIAITITITIILRPILPYSYQTFSRMFFQ